MGLFSRKAPPAPTSVKGDDFYESGDTVLLGSAGDDMDAETDVVGESEFRDTLCMFISIGEDDGGDVSKGRLPFAFTLEPQGGRLAVTCAGLTFGYVEDEASSKWLARVRAWHDRDMKVMCAGVILWNPRLGDPREDASIPVGVRLDLVDQS